MTVVRFLERRDVIRFFGAALIMAPFINIFLHLTYLKNESHLTWSQVDFMFYFKSGSFFSYALALFSVGIGSTMLSGAVSAWRYVLLLLGTHLLIQVFNFNSKAWLGPLAWPSFILNAGVFFFIFDQLVWRVKAEGKPKPAAVPLALVKDRYIINLSSYRRILFGFNSPVAWGHLKTLSSEELGVKKIAEVPLGIENQVIQINFSTDVVMEIKYSHQKGEMYYFKPLNMEKELVTRLNKWLKKIAV